jgi:hypothetical protein
LECFIEMHVAGSKTVEDAHPQRRRAPRYAVQCRARIRIGTRQYAGYIHNISEGGAKLRTITPIHRTGRVILRLPDLPPLRCELCWKDSYNAGVAFELRLPPGELSRWLQARSLGDPATFLAEFAELDLV